MTQKMAQGAEEVRPFADPIANDPAFQQTESRIPFCWPTGILW